MFFSTLRSEIAENHANQTILGFHSTAVICVRVEVLALKNKSYCLFPLNFTHLEHTPLAHIETTFVWFHAECGVVWVEGNCGVVLSELKVT